MIFGGFNDKGQLTQLLQRRLNLTGDAPVPAVMPELGVGLIWENDRPEWGWLKGEFRFSTGQVALANIGGPSAIVLEPPSRDTICVVNRLVISVSTAQSVIVDMRPAGFTGWGGSTPYQVFNTDDRAPDSTVLTGAFGWAAAFAAPSRELGRYTLAAAAPLTVDVPFVLSSRRCLMIRGETSNINLRATISGYLRPAQPGELG